MTCKFKCNNFFSCRILPLDRLICLCMSLSNQVTVVQSGKSRASNGHAPSGRYGAWRRLAMYPDNFTYLSVIGRISVRGEGAWRRLQTRTRVQVHQWAANYFLVRMVVPGTK